MKTTSCSECGSKVPLSSGFEKFTVTTQQSCCLPCFEQLEELERTAQLRQREKRQLSRIQETKKRIIPARYFQTDISHPDFNRKLYDAVMEWSPSEETPWLGLVGETGLCKSRCASLRLAAFVDSGRRGLFASAAELGSWVERQFSDSPEERSSANANLRETKSVEILLLDDLGKLRPSEAKVHALFDILEARSSQDRPLIWTANSHPGMFTRTYQLEYRDPIAGRLIEASSVLEIG